MTTRQEIALIVSILGGLCGIVFGVAVFRTHSNLMITRRTKL